jgi:hypothetical protein
MAELDGPGSFLGNRPVTFGSSLQVETIVPLFKQYPGPSCSANTHCHSAILWT